MQSNDHSRTKDDYKQMIELALETRRDALQEITRLTLASFSDDAILKQADIALTAYRRVRELKERMRESFPPSCSCNCHEDDTPE